jgi:hypothetical protein
MGALKITAAQEASFELKVIFIKRLIKLCLASWGHEKSDKEVIGVTDLPAINT